MTEETTIIVLLSVFTIQQCILLPHICACSTKTNKSFKTQYTKKKDDEKGEQEQKC